MTASAVRYDRGDDGIVTLTFDDPGARANTMNDAFVAAFRAAVDRLESEGDGLVGVLLASAKKSFFAGGDLERLRAATPESSAEQTAYLNGMKADMRRLEMIGRPVVALIGGSALGGGCELALIAHHRVALDAPGSRIGVPEVGLGLLPGGGGVTRLVRMLGLQRALQEVILPATRFSPREALAQGLVDEVVDDPAELEARGRAWIATHPVAVNPWDEKEYRMPGGAPSSPGIAAALPVFIAQLRARLHGAPMPAPRATLAAAVEGANVDFDTASLIETRYFVSLANGQVAKNMITAFFFDLQRLTDPDLIRQIGSVPLGTVELPSPFTNRIMQAFLTETGAILDEGVASVVLQQAIRQIGFAPAATRRLLEENLPRQAAEAVADVSFADIQERMLFAEAIEAVRCFDDGIVAGVPDANIWSLFGAGFPAWTGGVLQYITQYAGGVAGFAVRADELAGAYGERFRPPTSLLAKAAAGEVYG
ncbi:MAG: enoyl-CoA hydratase/isomerase family protein [Actinobacteria bacterium]|nr:enoyl-CoA hydratase/isomerase family protein [Actinomycetota bacterium]